MVDKSLQTKHTGTYASQSRVGVDVRGRLFVTTRYTEKTSLTSQLAMLADSETTYIWYMNYQLSLSIVIVRHFCRDVPRNINCHLSSDTRILRQVYTEAEYYLLDSLADIYIISSQLCILHMGHKEFLEE